MALKKIKLQNCKFLRGSIKIGPAKALTTVSCEASFDVIVAEAMGCKGAIFGPRKEQDDNEVTQYSVTTLELYGSKLELRPKQFTTDGRVTVDSKFILPTLLVSGFEVTDDREKERMFVTFYFQMDDTDGVLHGIINNIGRGLFDLDIPRAPAAEVEKAVAQLKLTFEKPKRKITVDEDEAKEEEGEEGKAKD